MTQGQSFEWSRYKPKEDSCNLVWRKTFVLCNLAIHIFAAPNLSTKDDATRQAKENAIGKSPSISCIQHHLS